MTQTEKHSPSWEGLAVVFLLSMLLIATGILSIYCPAIRFDLFISIMGIIITAFGLIKIVLYLVRMSYRLITNYDFSIGLILASIGTCLIANAPKLEEGSVQFLGLFVLTDAIIMIQHALQIRFMDGKSFPFAMLIAIGVYGFGLLCMIEPYDIFHRYTTVFSVLLSISGGLVLVSLLMTWYRSRNLAKEEERDAKRFLEEAMDDPVPEKEDTGNTEEEKDEEIDEEIDEEKELPDES